MGHDGGVSGKYGSTVRRPSEELVEIIAKARVWTIKSANKEMTVRYFGNEARIIEAFAGI